MIVGRRTYPIMPSTISLMNRENNFLKTSAPLWGFGILHLIMKFKSSSCESNELVTILLRSCPLETVPALNESIKGSQNLYWDWKMISHQ